MTTILSWFAALRENVTLRNEAALLRLSIGDLTDRVKTLGEVNTDIGNTLSSVGQETAKLQDRLDACVEDRTRLWDLVHQAIENERLATKEAITAYQSHVNLAWQKSGAGTPYPEAPHLQQKAPQDAGPLGPARSTMSGRMRAKTGEFIRQYVEDKKGQ